MPTREGTISGSHRRSAELNIINAGAMTSRSLQTGKSAPDLKLSRWGSVALRNMSMRSAEASTACQMELKLSPK